MDHGKKHLDIIVTVFFFDPCILLTFPKQYYSVTVNNYIGLYLNEKYIFWRLGLISEQLKTPALVYFQRSVESIFLFFFPEKSHKHEVSKKNK